MNGRIRELAEQARIQYEQDGAKVQEPGQYYHEDVVSKFAELIVRECMWKIMQRKEEAIDNDWYVDEAMSTALSDISEHFGVEE